MKAAVTIARLMLVNYSPQLVAVGLSGDPTVKLLLKEDSVFHGPYLTLSHRWGDSPMFKLAGASLENVQSGILLSDLPKTFREAIQITRRFGTSYLWIDSICIVQDSPEDWKIESLQMEKVYSHSQLNIAATSSGSSNGGLFRQRQPDREWPWFTEACFGDNDRRRCLMYDQSLGLRELDKTPLDRRAWVLQGRLLAPRVFYFGEFQLF
jgi:hypothetical protein